ncbi:hypothetical protein [Marinomonas sp. GJ51-6]|uniref:hypothetical protein n=1 Tax=Marinomonas sp. GJ51-6 TaxID=2992802 RepID=UPI0029349C17|nr:hypothetical protein [Marinomonas sp. GJ51-6]WOD06173.1 hypothetical protein ONZ50_10525 [Marinomonas sp. GJ51-6]
MNIIFYGASVTAQKEQAGYYHALKRMFNDRPDIEFHQVSFAASVFDQAGFAFMRSIEDYTSEGDVCFIDWLTPSAAKFNKDKISALTAYIVSLGALPVWVNFPRLDDLNNERPCYEQIRQHCIELGLPFIDAWKDPKVNSVPIEEVLRDVVHTTPLGGQLYADVLASFIYRLTATQLSVQKNIMGALSEYKAPALVTKEIILDNSKQINLTFNVPYSIRFELYFLAEIDSYTPLLSLEFTNLTSQETETYQVNCLDIWSHYNRSKCIKVLWLKVDKGDYRLSIKSLNKPAIDEVEVKKPVDKDIYPDNQPLLLPIQQMSCNVDLKEIITEELNHV